MAIHMHVVWKLQRIFYNAISLLAKAKFRKWWKWCCTRWFYLSNINMFNLWLRLSIYEYR